MGGEVYGGYLVVFRGWGWGLERLLGKDDKDMVRFYFKLREIFSIY